MSTLKQREKRQVRALHAHVGTTVFFKNRPWLARTAPGRKALKVAHVWIPILRRELAETKAALTPRRPAAGPSWLVNAFMCVHRYEGSWTDDGAPYWGGLQMDYSFMSSYGGSLLASKGTANHWTPAEQIAVAIRAYNSGRGFGPWPNTARMCGLR